MVFSGLHAAIVVVFIAVVDAGDNDDDEKVLSFGLSNASEESRKPLS